MKHPTLKLTAFIACGACALGSLACEASEPAKAPVLMNRDLIAGPDKEVVMLTVTSPPGGKSPAHRHDAQVFVYMLEGEMDMQAQGKPLVTLHPGDTFYEAPEDVHTVSANHSKTQPAKFLVVMIKDKNKPITTPVEASTG